MRSSALGRRRAGLETALLEDAAAADYHRRRFLDLLPHAGKLRERLRDDQPVVRAQPLEAGVVGMQPAHAVDVCRCEQRSRAAAARVADRPEALAVRAAE